MLGRRSITFAGPFFPSLFAASPLRERPRPGFLSGQADYPNVPVASLILATFHLSAVLKLNVVVGREVVA